MMDEPLTVPPKACPVVLRQAPRGIEILAFRHPLAGNQLVKGTIETGETAEAAALRELREESGITDAVGGGFLGKSEQIDPAQCWHFVLCEIRNAPDNWVHATEDDGGREFSFFWHPLNAPANEEWHPNFIRALKFIQGELGRAPS